MNGTQPDNDETTHERPSSFREMLLRDRRLVSRRQMDRRIRDRAADRAAEEDNGTTYFPALKRWFSGGPVAEIRAVLLVVLLVMGAFFFGRWVGQQDPPAIAPQTAGVVAVL